MPYIYERFFFFIFCLFCLDNNLRAREAAAPVRLSADGAVQRVPLHQVHVHGRRLQASPSSRGRRVFMIQTFTLRCSTIVL